MLDWLQSLRTVADPLAMLAVAGFLSAGITALLYLWARKKHLMPAVRSRDVHARPKPRVGGVAMWLAVAVTVLWFLPTLRGQEVSMAGWWGIFAGMAIILVSGLIDDIRGLPWYGQLAAQAAAAAAVVVSGVGIDLIRLPWGGDWQLAGALAAGLTAFWIMLMINVMNWFDGLDGLAGSIAVTSAVALYFVSLRVGSPATAAFTLVIAGAAIGFLVWNWYPSKLFMGTVGSQLLGFLLAVAAIVSGGKLATTFLVLGIPVFDALLVVGGRLLAGKSPFQADQRHLHHRLLRLGLPVPWVVLAINGIAVVFAVAAVRAQHAQIKGMLSLGVVAVMVFVLLVIYLLERRLAKRV